MNNPKLNHAMRQLRYWQNVVRRLTSDTEKEETEKRDIPPTPPIERKGKEEKEAHTLTYARAREGAPSDDRLGDLFRNPTAIPVPTLEQAKSYAANLVKGSTPAMVEEWFADCRAAQWRDKDGQPIRNWGNHLNKFVKYHPLFERIRDPDRIYDCRRKDEPKPDPAVAAREKRAKEIADELRKKGLL